MSSSPPETSPNSLPSRLGHGKVAVILTTLPDVETARSLADQFLATHTAACVSILPAVESHYIWQGRRETSAEILLLIKTAPGALPKALEFLAAHHPYQCPEMLHWQVESAPAYAAWVMESVSV